MIARRPESLREEGFAVNRELKREKAWSRIHLVPLLLAEADRDTYRREQAQYAREKEIMKDVPDWEVSVCLKGRPQEMKQLSVRLIEGSFQGTQERIQHQAVHAPKLRCPLSQAQASQPYNHEKNHIIWHSFARLSGETDREVQRNSNVGKTQKRRERGLYLSIEAPHAVEVPSTVEPLRFVINLLPPLHLEAPRSALFESVSTIEAIDRTTGKILG